MKGRNVSKEKTATALDDLSSKLSVDRALRVRAPRLRRHRNTWTGASPGADMQQHGRALTDRCLPRLQEFIANYSPSGPRSRVWSVLRKIDLSLSALAILSGAIRVSCFYDDDDDAATPTRRAVANCIGHNLYGECLRADLLRPDAADHGNVDWSPEQIMRAGLCGLAVLLEVLGDIFEQYKVPRGKKNHICLRLTERGGNISDETLAACARNNRHFMPSVTPLPPWVTAHRIGSLGERQHLVRRGSNSKTAAVVQTSVAAGRMRGVLDAVNHLEATEWVINEPMLRFVKNAAKTGHPEIPLASAGDKVMFKIDMQVADLLVGQTFKVAKEFDFRGRVYSTPSFHYGRGDYIRSLFQIDHGKPLDADGLRWLKIYVCTAAAGQHHKPGNLKLDEREQWADERLATLVDLGQVVFEGREVRDNELLKRVGDPFQFVAACVELYRANKEGPGFISQLPVSLDATCSGLQIISALTRSEVEGHLVNLMPDASPQDFYRLIAETVRTLVEKDATAASRIKSKFKPPKVSVWLLYSVTAARPDLGAPWVFCLLNWLFYGDLRLYARILTVPGLVSFDRDRMKTPVMTHFYSAKPFGVAQRLEKDKKFPPLPFRARYYLAKKIREAIKIKASRCTKFMDFLKKIEWLLASEGKFLQVTLPDGFLFENRYHEPKIKTMEFYVNGRRASCEVTIGDLPAIRKAKAVSSVCPNLVHALDACHVRLFALGARDANIAVATNHDCFIGLAADATRIQEISLDRFASIYEDRDILGEILAWAKRVLTPANRRKLPKLPKYGTLNIGDVRNAQYAIS
jgi:hypothetical protein